MLFKRKGNGMMYMNDTSMIMTRCLTAVVIKDDLYAVDGNTGFLNVIDLNDRSVKKTIYIEKIYASPVRLAYVSKIGQSIWIVPLKATMIAEYNLETENVSFYNLGVGSIYSCSYVINLGTTIYLIPHNLSERLLQFSTKTHEICSDERWLEKTDINRNKTIFMVSNLDSKIFCVLVNDNRIISFDLLTGVLQEKRLNVGEETNGIAILNGKICITFKEMKCVLLWEYDTDSVRRIKLERKDEFFNPLIVEDRILLSNGQSMFWLFDGQIEEIKNVNELKNDTTRAAHFYRGYNWKNKIILPPSHSNMLLEIDKDTYEAKGFVISIPENDIRRYFTTGTPIKENEWSSLADYINII